MKRAHIAAIAALLGFSTLIRGTATPGESAPTAEAASGPTVTPVTHGSAEHPAPAVVDELDALLAPSDSIYAGAPADRVLPGENGLGGHAILLQDVHGNDLPGTQWMLAASDTTDKTSIWDETPRVIEGERHLAKLVASNLAAHSVAEALLGTELPLIDVVGTSGDGPSAGAILLVMYMDLGTGGTFSNGTSIAATGALGSYATLHPITNAERKLVAATAVEADVLFTTTDIDNVEELGVWKGPALRRSIAEQREWFRYIDWGRLGANSEHMDVVYVTHFGDIAAYLCGTGSSVACQTLITLNSFNEELPDHARARNVEARIEATTTAE